MKRILIISILFVAIVSSCSEELNFDTTGYLTGDRKQELIDTDPNATAILIKANLSGVYDIMSAYSFNGNSNHDYFGHKSIQLATDLTGSDMVQDIHHHFGYDYNCDNRDATYRRTKHMWALYYKIVSSANTMLEDYYSSAVTDEKLIALKGEILTLRGFAYFNLVNLYATRYVNDELGLGVPLLLSTDAGAQPRATKKAVYEQIINDLRFGVKNNKVTSAKNDADKGVAAAYLAKSFAAMEQWDSCAYYANIACDGASLKMSTPFANINNSDWMWGYDINGETTTLFASFYSHIDNTIPGYAGELRINKSIHNHLYNKMSETDSRRDYFKDSLSNPTLAAQYPNLFEFANLKYITPSDFSGDYCFLRFADPYLLYVEALVELNRVAEAQSALNSFIQIYDASYNASNFSNVSDLREEVRIQRRIELWGEGTSFFDMKRWNIGIIRNAPNTNHRVIIDIPAGDKRLTYQIPQNEIDANDQIVQND